MLLLILTALLALLYLSSRWVEHKRTCAETARKLIHLTLGLTTLTFPWLFTEFWQVLILCLASYAIFLAAKFHPKLHQLLGLGLFSIKRTSRGELYFAASIILLFYFSTGDKLLYLLPLSLLTFADSAAALIGKHHGKHRFRVLTTHKSWQGSAAFLATALTLSIPLLAAFTNLSLPVILLIALGLSLLTALAEAVSWNGVDNLLIPLTSFLFLRQSLHQSPSQLALQLGLMLSLVFIAWSLNKATKLTTHTILGSAFLLSLGSCFLLLN